MKVWAENLEDFLAQVSDYRLYEEQVVRACLLFAFHAEDLFSKYEVVYRGHNVASLGWCYRLIVKAVIADTPLVAFISERTPTRCMSVFVRQLEEGRVKWSPDKFAGN